MRTGVVIALMIGLITGAALGGCSATTGDDEPDTLCGNGVLDPGEGCDDGNRISHDGCSETCRPEAFCSNGVVEPGEECDDGNFTPGDGCNQDCTVEVGCGNGWLDVGEECDDDNLQDGDGCSGLCKDEVPGALCGNGIVELGEGCDDGNLDDGDGCSSTCSREDGCGNGAIDGSEECDDGNNISGDGCSANCLLEFVCGNGVCEEQNHETCEACPQECCPDCGNGILDVGEACDDGNNDPGDGCSRGCLDEDGQATCGNGIWEAGEECEDGNTTIRDGCSDSCQIEFVCGDQTCDSNTGETCQLCPVDCCPNCGNGVREVILGEECDSGVPGLTCDDFCYDGGTISCTAWCTIDLSQCAGPGPICGDGVAECGELCDGNDLLNRTCADVGYADGTLACDGSCNLDSSGCSGLIWYLNQDFEDEAMVQLEWTLLSDWGVGIPTGIFDEPDTAFEGLSCLGTRVNTKHSINQEYLTNMAISPEIDLTPATTPQLVFQMWGASTPVNGFNVWITNNGGIDWTVLPNPSVAYDGASGGELAWNGSWAHLLWEEVRFDLTAFAGDVVHIGFAMWSDSSNPYCGMYVDNVLVAEVNLVPVEITVPGGTTRVIADAPFDFTVSAVGGMGAYDWAIVGGINHGWMSIDPSTGVLTGQPTLANLGPVSVDVRCQESTMPSNQDVETLSFEVVNTVLFEDFEGAAAPTGWTFAQDWEWGSPSAVGPSACYDGTHCAGTVMNGNYSSSMAYATCVMDSVPVDLSGLTTPVLSFMMWNRTVAAFEGGNVKISTDGGINWTLLQPQGGYDGTANNEECFYGNNSALGWHEKVFDLTPYAGQTAIIRWAFASSPNFNVAGWYIDAVTISTN